jgi:hypothetical protein
MSTLVWNLLLPVMLVLSTATPGAGVYYVDSIDGVIEVASVADSGPLVAGTIVETLPDGARSVTIEKTQYFVSSSNWFVAVVEGTIHYMVVLAPL